MHSSSLAESCHCSSFPILILWIPLIVISTWLHLSFRSLNDWHICLKLSSRLPYSLLLIMFPCSFTHFSHHLPHYLLSLSFLCYELEAERIGTNLFLLMLFSQTYALTFSFVMRSYLVSTLWDFFFFFFTTSENLSSPDLERCSFHYYLLASILKSFHLPGQTILLSPSLTPSKCKPSSSPLA